MGKDIRVAICTPHTGHVPAGYAFALAKMMQCFTASKYEGGKHECEPILVGGSILPYQRQKCLGFATQWDATHILWLDSDMKVPPDTIQCLLKHGLPIVGANYGRTSVPSVPTAYRDDDEFTGVVFTRPESTGLEMVNHIGLGCCLMDIEMFDFIEGPFFMFEPVQEGRSWRGEDVYLFKKLRETVGIQPFVDHDLSKRVAHLGTFEFTNQICVLNEEARLNVLRANDAAKVDKERAAAAMQDSIFEGAVAAEEAAE